MTAHDQTEHVMNTLKHMAEVEAKRLEMLADVEAGKEPEYNTADYVEMLRKRVGGG